MNIILTLFFVMAGIVYSIWLYERGVAEGHDRALRLYKLKQCDQELYVADLKYMQDRLAKATTPEERKRVEAQIRLLEDSFVVRRLLVNLP